METSIQIFIYWRIQSSATQLLVSLRLFKCRCELEQECGIQSFHTLKEAWLMQAHKTQLKQIRALHIICCQNRTRSCDVCSSYRDYLWCGTSVMVTALTQEASKGHSGGCTEGDVPQNRPAAGRDPNPKWGLVSTEKLLRADSYHKIVAKFQKRERWMT